uniref:Putative secreted protein n=1 Tax=Ixodes ricinus TaxID=34613 RepID=A0A6B0USN3_IXORI
MYLVQDFHLAFLLVHRAFAFSLLNAILFEEVGYLRKISHALCCFFLVVAQSSFHQGLHLLGKFSEVQGMASWAALMICSVTYTVASSGDKFARTDGSSTASSLKSAQSALSSFHLGVRFKIVGRGTRLSITTGK